MNKRRRSLALTAIALPLAASRELQGQVPASPAQSAPTSPLFAVEFRTGPNWDQAKKPAEQAWFREHSANLKRLRDAGSLVIGARYSDKGFILIAAESEAGARALIDVDPSIQNQVFAYEVHPFHVFYAGCVQPPKRPA